MHVCRTLRVMHVSKNWLKYKKWPMVMIIEKDFQFGKKKWSMMELRIEEKSDIVAVKIWPMIKKKPFTWCNRIRSSVFVFHGFFLKSNRWELFRILLNLVSELCNLRLDGPAGMHCCHKVFQLCPCVSKTADTLLVSTR